MLYNHAGRPTFQSTHPCGVRHISCLNLRRCTNCFNPRTPAGCDCLAPVLLSIFLCFNPRTPAGCDQGARQTYLCRERVSIHAPLRGATPHTGAVGCSPLVSIHAPLRGATPRNLEHEIGPTRRFNPRTPAGCDSGCGHNPRKYEVSIHAPLRGATR